MSQLDDAIRDQLLGRRAQLQRAVAVAADRPELTQLLGEVDAALSRLEGRGFGLCETSDTCEPSPALPRSPTISRCSRFDACDDGCSAAARAHTVHERSPPRIECAGG